MKKLSLIFIAGLLLFIGCRTDAPVLVNLSNQTPIAHIDSITPTEIYLEDSVTFVGHGTDPDGTIVAYNWRSSLDGQLSTEASFSTSSLSEGEHIIYVEVKDNNGKWSE